MRCSPEEVVHGRPCDCDVLGTSDVSRVPAVQYRHSLWFARVRSVDQYARIYVPAILRGPRLGERLSVSVLYSPRQSVAAKRIKCIAWMVDSLFTDNVKSTYI